MNSADKLKELRGAPPTPDEQHRANALTSASWDPDQRHFHHAQPSDPPRRWDNKWVLFQATALLVICYLAIENEGNHSSTRGIPDPEGHAYRNRFLQKTVKKGPFKRVHSKSIQQSGVEPAKGRPGECEHRPAVQQGSVSFP